MGQAQVSAASHKGGQQAVPVSSAQRDVEIKLLWGEEPSRASPNPPARALRWSTEQQQENPTPPTHPPDRSQAQEMSSAFTQRASRAMVVGSWAK